MSTVSSHTTLSGLESFSKRTWFYLEILRSLKCKSFFVIYTNANSAGTFPKPNTELHSAVPLSKAFHNINTCLSCVNMQEMM